MPEINLVTTEQLEMLHTLIVDSVRTMCNRGTIVQESDTFLDIARLLHRIQGANLSKATTLTWGTLSSYCDSCPLAIIPLGSHIAGLKNELSAERLADWEIVSQFMSRKLASQMRDLSEATPEELDSVFGKTHNFA